MFESFAVTAYRCMLWAAATALVVQVAAIMLAGDAAFRVLIQPASKMSLLLSFPLFICSVPFASLNPRLALIGFLLAYLCLIPFSSLNQQNGSRGSVYLIIEPRMQDQTEDSVGVAPKRTKERFEGVEGGEDLVGNRITQLIP